jgi:hypothetical protein
MFDACIIEAGTARQKRVFEGLEKRRFRGLYPRVIDFQVMADPEGGRVGSGGALLNVLPFRSLATPVSSWGRQGPRPGENQWA